MAGYTPQLPMTFSEFAQKISIPVLWLGILPCLPIGVFGSEGSSPEAVRLFNKGTTLKQPRPGQPRDAIGACNLYEQAVLLGYAPAQFNLANCFKIEMYEKAANLANMLAQALLWEIYSGRTDYSVTPDTDRAEAWRKTYDFTSKLTLDLGGSPAQPIESAIQYLRRKGVGLKPLESAGRSQ